ncbi:MAG: glycosyltransferase family 2 protein [Acidimicrobiales bacterium]
MSASVDSEAVDFDAVAAFATRYGQPELGPVVVVIPAYNEAPSIAPVINSIPYELLGQRVSCLVVVDGATDDTAQVASERGAYVCAASANRGQGAALRLGYGVAVAHGARYLVVIDADGQYDANEMEGLVKPLASGHADLVLGSRRLGNAQVDDRVRYAGVVIFSALISRLTGCRVTDSSSGFKAMTAKVAATVELNEPQYQASELLIGALGRGFKVSEVPVTMRPRSAGFTKKAPNLLYGMNYARVILRTWLRER